MQNPKNGQCFIVYHRWQNPKGAMPFTGERQVSIDRLRYAADGTILPIRMTD